MIRRAMSALLMLTITAAADPVRFPARASYGEMVPSAIPCGRSTREEVWRFFADHAAVTMRGGRLELEPRHSGIATPSNRTMPLPDGVLGIFHRGKYTLIVSVRRYRELAITYVLESNSDTRDQVSCWERWSGMVAPS